MDDLEEFLRRAAEKRQARKGGGAPQRQQPPQRQPPQQQPPPQQRAPQPQRRPQQQQQRSTPPPQRTPPPRRVSPAPEIIPESVMQAEIISDQSPWGDSVAGHVAQHLSPRDLQQRGRDFGRSVDEADDKLDSHLHDVFDHRVGNLSRGSTSEVKNDVQDAYEDKKPEVMEPGVSIQQMLSNPETLRNAFILSEIFRRPEI